MKVSVLCENTVCSSRQGELASEHGISMYIEFKKKKILFDTGQTDLFLRNAEKMNIDLSQVDYLFISHAHADHGGGILHFLRMNTKAKVYLNTACQKAYYSKRLKGMTYIGLNIQVLKDYKDRVVFTDGVTKVESGISFIAGFTEKFPRATSNLFLYKKVGDDFQHDDFLHESILLLQEDTTDVLFTACSHSGIINMLDEALPYTNIDNLKAVFGGFHTSVPKRALNESPAYLQQLSDALSTFDTCFYTGHCTGLENFDFFKRNLGDKLQTMNCGEEFSF